MENPKIRLSVVIPAYNEEKRLPKTLEDINNYLKRQNYLSEIIIVDGGSKDRTSEVVKEFQEKIANLKLLRVENIGKGYAVKSGMLSANGEYRIFTDADNSTSIGHMEKMWPEFENGYDVIIGSRDIKGAVLSVPQPWFRKVIFGGGFRLLRKIIVGLWQIQDTQCGFKALTAKAAQDIFLRIRILRWGFDPELLVLAKKFGYKIKEIPITWINDPESKVKLKSAIQMFFELFQVRLNLILGKYNRPEVKEVNNKGVVWRKKDLFFGLIIGEIIGLLVFGIMKTLGIEAGLSQLLNFFSLIFFVFFSPLAAAAGLYITYFLGKKMPVFFQAGKFIIVGVFNTLLDWGALNLLASFFGIFSGIFYSLFKAISFGIAVTNSYFLNKFWTFGKEKEESEKGGKEFASFLIVSLFGLVINVAIASFVVNIIGPKGNISPEVWGTVGAGIATVFSTLWNFLGYKFIVFKK